MVLVAPGLIRTMHTQKHDEMEEVRAAQEATQQDDKCKIERAVTHLGRGQEKENNNKQ